MTNSNTMLDNSQIIWDHKHLVRSFLEHVARLYLSDSSPHLPVRPKFSVLPDGMI